MKKIILVLMLLIVHCTMNIENCMCQWVQLPNGFGNNAYIKNIVAVGNNIFAGTYNYFAPSAVYRSTNNGAGWTNVITTLVRSLTANENRIFVATEYIDVMYSDDMGSNWMGPILQGNVIGVIAANGNNIFAGSTSVYLSTNNGINWTQTFYTIDRYVNCFAINGNNIFVGAGSSPIPYVSGGVYLSTNNGSNWTLTALNDRHINSLAVSGNNIFAGTYANGVYFSTNNGSNWTQTSLSNGQVYSLAISGNYVFAGNDNGVFLSTNNGINWIQKNEGFGGTLYVSSFLIKDNYIFAGAGYSVWRRNLSEILGINYSVSGSVKYSDNNQPVTSGIVKAFKFDRNTWNVVYLDSANIQSDGSYTLTNIPQDTIDIGVFPNSTPPNDYVITYYPSTIYWDKATTLYPTGNLTNIDIGAIRMTKTTNNNSVKGRISGVADSYANNLKDAYMYAKNGNTFVMCTVSDANGRYNLQSLPAGNLKIVSTRLGFSRDSVDVNVTSTSNIDSINFQLNRFTVGIKQINSTVPSEFKLFQNYPNPFNPVTNIKYQITNNKLVTLKIYSILGKEVATLVNEKQEPGVYEVTFDARHGGSSTFPSGIYFYRLRAGDFIDTKRMVLIK